jgi:hypothetical protein
MPAISKRHPLISINPNQQSDLRLRQSQAKPTMAGEASEYRLDTEEVTGSIPLSPTSLRTGLKIICHQLAIKTRRCFPAGIEQARRGMAKAPRVRRRAPDTDRPPLTPAARHARGAEIRQQVSELAGALADTASGQQALFASPGTTRREIWPTDAGRNATWSPDQARGDPLRSASRASLTWSMAASRERPCSSTADQQGRENV